MHTGFAGKDPAQTGMLQIKISAVCSGVIAQVPAEERRWKYSLSPAGPQGCGNRAGSVCLKQRAQGHTVCKTGPQKAARGTGGAVI